MVMTFLWTSKQKSRDALAALVESLRIFIALVARLDPAPPPQMDTKSG